MYYRVTSLLKNPRKNPKKVLKEISMLDKKRRKEQKELRPHI